MDGDQLSVKVPFVDETNEELAVYMNSKFQYMSLSGINIRTPSNECIQALYDLTKDPKTVKLTQPVFK